MFLAAVSTTGVTQTAGVVEMFGVIFCGGIQSCTTMSCQWTHRLVFHAHSYWRLHTQLPVTVSFPLHLSLSLSLAISPSTHTATQLWHHRGGNTSSHHNHNRMSNAFHCMLGNKYTKWKFYNILRQGLPVSPLRKTQFEAPCEGPLNYSWAHSLRARTAIWAEENVKWSLKREISPPGC